MLLRSSVLGWLLGGIATVVAAEPAVPPLPVGQWVEFVAKDIVTSEPALELFCADGRWIIRGDRRANSGTYQLSGGKLCASYPGGKFCRDLSRSPDGHLIASEKGRNATRLRTVSPPPSVPNPADLCANGGSWRQAVPPGAPPAPAGRGW